MICSQYKGIRRYSQSAIVFPIAMTLVKACQGHPSLRVLGCRPAAYGHWYDEAAGVITVSPHMTLPCDDKLGN